MAVSAYKSRGKNAGLIKHPIFWSMSFVAGVFCNLESVSACGGWYDVGCNAGKAIEKGVQDIGKAAEKAAQDTGKATEKAAQDTGKAVEKAAQDTGKAVEKAAQDTGKAVEKAGQDTGKAIEKAGQDTGKALEKAGQGIGHLFGQLTNFKLNCSLPSSPPADVAAPYKRQCGGALSTYRNDLDVCNKAGGASIIAASTAGIALSAAYSAGATYALAKIAFEICQKSCNSQAELNQCVLNVDQEAKSAAGDADKAAKENNEADKLMAQFECIDSAYSGQKLVVMDNLVAACQARSDCSTESKEYAQEFINAVNRENAVIDRRRNAVLISYKQGKSIFSEFGSWIEQPGWIKSISVLNDADKSNACLVKSSSLTATAILGPEATGRISARWTQYGRLISQTFANVDSKNHIIASHIDLAKEDYGAWRISFLSDNGTVLGGYGFVYRPDEITR